MALQRAAGNRAAQALLEPRTGSKASSLSPVQRIKIGGFTSAAVGEVDTSNLSRAKAQIRTLVAEKNEEAILTIWSQLRAHVEHGESASVSSDLSEAESKSSSSDESESSSDEYVFASESRSESDQDAITDADNELYDLMMPLAQLATAVREAKKVLEANIPSTARTTAAGVAKLITQVAGYTATTAGTAFALMNWLTTAPQQSVITGEYTIHNPARNVSVHMSDGDREFTGHLVEPGSNTTITQDPITPPEVTLAFHTFVLGTAVVSAGITGLAGAAWWFLSESTSTAEKIAKANNVIDESWTRMDTYAMK